MNQDIWPYIAIGVALVLIGFTAYKFIDVFWRGNIGF